MNYYLRVDSYPSLVYYDLVSTNAKLTINGEEVFQVKVC